MSSKAIKDAPKYFRATGAMGDANTVVTRDGGNFGHGLIQGVSVITRGEALGHGMWIDQQFLSDVEAAINLGEGVKSRFTHPGLSSDGVGQKLGRLTDAYHVGDHVYADLHLQEAATKTPDGNLADYVMTLAEETPEDFGLSIAFEHDPDSEEQFELENTINGRWISPDENNLDNLPHVRLARLMAGDVVDSPAANPDGLFQRGQDAAQQGEALAEYILGLTDEKPDAELFGVDGDRAKQFFTRFLGRHNLSVKKGGDTVADEKATVETPSVDADQVRTEFHAELNRFVTKFGAENGTKWFGEQKSYAEALELHCEELGRQLAVRDTQLSELNERLASLNTGEEEPASHGGEADGFRPRRDRSSLASRIRITGKHYDN